METSFFKTKLPNHAQALKETAQSLVKPAINAWNSGNRFVNQNKVKVFYLKKRKS